MKMVNEKVNFSRKSKKNIISVLSFHRLLKITYHRSKFSLFHHFCLLSSRGSLHLPKKRSHLLILDWPTNIIFSFLRTRNSSLFLLLPRPETQSSSCIFFLLKSRCRILQISKGRLTNQCC